MNKIRVLIADDHSIVRSGLFDLLSAEGSFDVIGTARNGREAIDMSDSTKPDVVVMDLFMPEVDGVEATGTITQRNPETKVLVLTSICSSDSISNALKAGASGAIMKDAENQDLIEAIKCVHDGGTILSDGIRRLIREDPPLPDLSKRQKELLASITRGLTNTDIARLLNIGTGSVRTHMAKLFAKIGAANRTEAVAIALRKNLLKI